MLFFIVLVIAIIVIWALFTRKYVNPYRLHFLFGKKGAGKTTYMVKMMVRYLKKGWHVYTDMNDVNIPGIRIIDGSDLGEFIPEPNSVVFLDEAGIRFDSRNFKNFPPELRDFFKLQRKYRCIVYMNSQSFDVDKKIRDLTDYMYLQINLFRIFSIGKRIDRKVALVQSTAQGDSRIAEDLKFSPFYTWTFTYIPKYARYFESFEAPKRPYLTFTEVMADVSQLLDNRIPKDLEDRE